MTRVRPMIQERLDQLTEKAFADALESGDFSNFDAISARIRGEEKAIALTRSMLKTAVRGVIAINNERGMPESASINPLLSCRFLLEELLIRAIAEDEQCLNRSWKHFREICTAFTRLQRDYGWHGEGLNIATGPDSALEPFRRAYEIYLKTVQVIVHLVDVVDKKPLYRYRRNMAFRRVIDFENGRYAIILPTDSMTIMRDAISHESVCVDTSKGRLVFTSDGGTRRLGISGMKSNYKDIVARLLVFLECVNVAQPYCIKIQEVATLERTKAREMALRVLRKRPIPKHISDKRSS